MRLATILGIDAFSDDDYAVSVAAAHVNQTADAELFRNRSMMAPFTIFNNATGFMESRNDNGVWAGPDQGWTEGDKWAYSFDVVHAVDELIAAGAEAADSPAAVARRSTVVITMVPDSPDVELVLEGSSGGFSALQAGSLIIDTSTIAPAVARRLAARAKELGSSMIDAPVSGGEVGAVNATLSIMIGGDAAALERVRPILACMGNP